MTDDNQTIEVDGQEYDAETVAEAMQDAIIGRAPVAVISDLSLRDGISNRLYWAHGATSLIAVHDEDADEDVRATAAAAALHLDQARDMFRELGNRMYPPKPRPDTPAIESRQNAE
jgi:hypothetical protein